MTDENTRDKQPEITQPDEDGTVMVYGFLQIKDAKTGEVLISTRS
jgi:hypothetical protein